MTKIFSYKYSILWSIIIIFLLLLPSNKLPETNIHFKYYDKIAHLGIFAILSILNFIEIKNKKKYYKIVILVFLFATITEILQLTLTKDRNFDILDIIADITGYYITYIVIKKLDQNKILKML